MPNPIEEQINRDPDLVFLDKFGKTKEFYDAGRVAELPIRLEAPNSFIEGVSLDPDQTPPTSPHVFVLPLKPDECYPYEYKGPEGFFSKKIHYSDEWTQRAFFTFEPVQPQPTPHQPYVRVRYDVTDDKEKIHFTMGIKGSGRDGTIVSGTYDQKGRLKQISCRVGEIPSNPDFTPDPKNGSYALYSGPYGLGFYDIKVSRFISQGGGARARFNEYYPFGKILTASDGRGVRIERRDNFLHVDAGPTDSLDNPTYSGDLPLQINASKTRKLLISRDKGSLIDLASWLQAGFKSEEHGVGFSRIETSGTRK